MVFDSKVRKETFGIVDIDFSCLYSGSFYVIYEDRKLIRDERVIDLKCGGKKPLARESVRPGGCG